MKRYVKLVSLVALAALLCVAFTGCIKLTETITVNADKSMDFVIDEGINIEKYQQMVEAYGGSSSSSSEDAADAIEQSIDSTNYGDWTVEKYNNGTYVGAKLSHHFDSIEKLRTSTGTYEDWGGFNLSSTYSTSTSDETSISDVGDAALFYYDEANKVYRLKIVMNSSSSEYADSSQYASLYSQMFDEMSVTVNLPSPAISNNATEVTNDGKTLVWKYTGTSMPDIEMSFSMENVNAVPWLWIIVGVVVVVVVVILIIVIAKTRKKPVQATAAGYDYQQAPVSGGVPYPNQGNQPYQPAMGMQGTQVAQPNVAMRDAYEKEMGSLNALLSAGVLTQEEYAQKADQIRAAYNANQQ